MTTAANNSSPNANTSRRATLMKWSGVFVAMVVLLTFVPLVRVVPLESTQQQAKQARFNASEFVDEFWPGALLNAAVEAVDMTVLRTALKSDPATAANRYGHRLGLSGSASYLVRGEGRILSVTTEAVEIAMDDTDDVAVRIEIGPVFGNALRDGSGQLDVSDFSNTRDFNDISAEINRRVEALVLPQVRALAVVGTKVRFAGGVEVSDNFNTSEALVLVPFIIEVP